MPRFPIEIANEPKKYRPVGHCIYCGVYSGKLEKEHIIPFGLAGNSLVLPKASCRDCAVITRDFEQVCLRHMWWPFRTRIGAPSRRGPPDTFNLRKMKVKSFSSDKHPNIDYEKVAEIPLPTDDYPFFYMAYKFPEPGILAGRDPAENVKFEAWLGYDEASVRKHMPNDKDGFQLAPLDWPSFSRMLAKIAHAYAVAELGSQGFQPLLRKLIRGKTAITPLNWVGGEMEIPPVPAEPLLHELRRDAKVVNGVRYLVVSIRLFSFFRTPQYYVVVGEL